MALYAKINKNGKLELVNELDINLGSSPEEILSNLQNKNYKKSDIKNTGKLGSDDKYSEIIRKINEDTPSRFNSDSRLLYGASGSAGKLAVFAVRLDTYRSPKENKVFYVGTNDPDVFGRFEGIFSQNLKHFQRLVTTYTEIVMMLQKNIVKIHF